MTNQYYHRKVDHIGAGKPLPLYYGTTVAVAKAGVPLVVDTALQFAIDVACAGPG